MGADPQVPVRWQCPACDGTGWEFSLWPEVEPDRRCSDCGGSGWLTPADFQALAAFFRVG